MAVGPSSSALHSRLMMTALLNLAIVATAAAGEVPLPLPTPDNLQDLPIAADSITYLDGT